MTTYRYQGFGVARADYALEHDALTVTLPGPQLGKSLHERTIPISAVTGFFVEKPVRLPGNAQGQAVGALARRAHTDGGKLIVAWRAGERTLTKTFMMVNVFDTGFSELLSELARRRPDADLRTLAPAEARARLGMWSDRSKSLVAIAVVVVVIAIAAIVFRFTH